MSKIVKLSNGKTVNLDDPSGNWDFVSCFLAEKEAPEEIMQSFLKLNKYTDGMVESSRKYFEDRCKLELSEEQLRGELRVEKTKVEKLKISLRALLAPILCNVTTGTILSDVVIEAKQALKETEGT